MFVVVQIMSHGVDDLLELVAEDRRQHESCRLRKYERRQCVDTDKAGDDAWNDRVRHGNVSLEWAQHVIHVAVGKEQAVPEECRTRADDDPRYPGVEGGEFPRVLGAGIIQDLVKHGFQPAAEAGGAERRLCHGALNDPGDRDQLVKQLQTKHVLRRKAREHSKSVEPQGNDNRDSVNQVRGASSRPLFPNVTGCRSRAIEI